MARNGKTRIAPIKAYRLRQRLTQQQLADMMKVNRVTVARLENYSRHVGRELAEKIAPLTKQTIGEVIDDYSEVAS